jgi:hypothetical protein
MTSSGLREQATQLSESVCAQATFPWRGRFSVTFIAPASPCRGRGTAAAVDEVAHQADGKATILAFVHRIVIHALAVSSGAPVIAKTDMMW